MACPARSQPDGPLFHGPLYLPRNKTGILGWRSEKTEMVNGYEAKVSSGSWSLGILSIHHPQLVGAEEMQHGGKA